ncbi:D-isomer specific 2-hydroxyacid dehydrogenase [Catenaria anguillulae PL171]|uniref:D-isomer specific 2-hydroxyacid dehydrogenase n=1 Tax=Catenaria anguillulae PL171 TaxID=765915 RepID=A0A1Y2HWN5_9FUNG|nr:D-isomer specific 2-hydroxyacid dehydrogenase [Catenaria anguillulae PL171]
MSPITHDTAKLDTSSVAIVKPVAHEPVADPASRKGILQILQRTPLFAQLDAKHLSMLADIVQPVKVGKGTILVSEGQVSDVFAIVVQGELLVQKKNAQKPSKLRPYDAFGFKNLFEECRSPSTLVAGEQHSCFTLQISRPTFTALLGREPTLALHLLPALAHHAPDATELDIVRPRSPSAEDLTQGVSGWPRTTSEVRIKLFDAKPYQTKLFEEQNALPGFGYQLEFLEPKLSLETVELARGAHAVCVFVHDSVDPEVAAKLKEMGIELVAYRCAGFDMCHVPTCDSLGITVARVPGYSPNAIAEHACALMMALNRKLIWANSRVHTGDFSLDGLVGFDMKGKTVGIVGTGKIGACLVSIMLGFGCHVICYDVYKNPALLANPSVSYVELDDLLKQSDIISLHAPLLDSTKHMINARSLATCKRGVMIINTSRGPLVDTKALIDALKSGQVGACGLDVVEGENDYFYENRSHEVVQNDQINHLLAFQNRVIITAHQAFLTEEALREIAQVTLKNVLDYHNGKRMKQLPNAVNTVNPAVHSA